MAPSPSSLCSSRRGWAAKPSGAESLATLQVPKEAGRGLPDATAFSGSPTPPRSDFSGRRGISGNARKIPGAESGELGSLFQPQSSLHGGRGSIYIALWCLSFLICKALLECKA